MCTVEGRGRPPCAMRLRTQRCAGGVGLAGRQAGHQAERQATSSAAATACLINPQALSTCSATSNMATANTAWQRSLQPAPPAGRHSTAQRTHLQACRSDLLWQQVSLVDCHNEAEAQLQGTVGIQALGLLQLVRQDAADGRPRQRAIKVCVRRRWVAGGRVGERRCSAGRRQSAVGREACNSSNALPRRSTGTLHPASAYQCPPANQLPSAPPSNAAESTRSRTRSHAQHLPATSTTQSTTERLNFWSWILPPTLRSKSNAGISASAAVLFNCLRCGEDGVKWVGWFGVASGRAEACVLPG